MRPWFDGYYGQRTVLFDDYGGNNKMDIVLALQMLDSRSCGAQWKGSTCRWRPETIIFTSNFHPHDWYVTTAPIEHLDAFKARITDIIKFTNQGRLIEIEDGRCISVPSTSSTNTSVTNQPPITTMNLIAIEEPLRDDELIDAGSNIDQIEAFTRFMMSE